VETGKSKTLALGAGAAGPKFSPDERFVAYWQGGAVWLADTRDPSAKIKVLPTDFMIHGDDYFWVGEAGTLSEGE
jgi:hypothetical protein